MWRRIVSRVWSERRFAWNVLKFVFLHYVNFIPQLKPQRVFFFSSCFYCDVPVELGWFEWTSLHLCRNYSGPLFHTSLLKASWETGLHLLFAVDNMRMFESECVNAATQRLLLALSCSYIILLFHCWVIIRCKRKKMIAKNSKFPSKFEGKRLDLSHPGLKFKKTWWCKSMTHRPGRTLN